MSKGAINIRSSLNRLKRLEKKLSENAPNGISKEKQRKFINEKAEAIERYLKAEPQEEDEALDEIYKINKKYGIKHNSTLPKHLRHYLD